MFFTKILIFSVIPFFISVSFSLPLYMNQDYALIIAKKYIAKYDTDRNNQLSLNEFQTLLVIESTSYF